MADLQDFIEDITTNKISFCAVCFRTEKERKLVPPKAISNFIKYTSLEELSDSELACVYCERQAEVALKLYNTLRYARHVSRVLCSLLSKSLMTPKSIAYLLPSKIRGQVSGPSSVKRNKLLSSLRQYQAYTQTDVLVVDASSGNNESESRNSEIFIIDDDDEDKSTEVNTPRLVPIEKLLQPQTTIDPKTVATNNQLLFPLKPAENSDNQYLVLPNNTKIVVGGNNFNLASNIPVILPDGTMVLTQQNPQILVPIIDNNIQNHSVSFNTDFVRVNTLDTVEEIILPDNRKIGEKVVSSVVLAKRANQNNIQQSNASQMNHVNQINMMQLGGVSQISGVSHISGANQISGATHISGVSQMTGASQINDNARQIGGQMGHNVSQKGHNMSQMGNLSQMSDTSQTDDKICQITDLRSLQEVEQPPEPKRTDKNIDWEDKIPMDVISFMETRNDTSAQTYPPSHGTPTLAPAPTHTPKAAEMSMTATPAIQGIKPVISKSYVPRIAPRTVVSIDPVTPAHKDTTNSPKDLNHSLDLFKTANKRGRKRKRDDDDDVIIVL